MERGSELKPANALGWPGASGELSAPCQLRNLADTMLVEVEALMASVEVLCLQHLCPGKRLARTGRLVGAGLCGVKVSCTPGMWKPSTIRANSCSSRHHPWGISQSPTVFEYQVFRACVNYLYTCCKGSPGTWGVFPGGWGDGMVTRAAKPMLAGS